MVAELSSYVKPRLCCLSMQPFSLGDQLVHQESAPSALSALPARPAAPQGNEGQLAFQEVWAFSRLQLTFSKDRPYCH